MGYGYTHIFNPADTVSDVWADSSALPTTRRVHSQLSSVRQATSRNRRAGLPVALLSPPGKPARFNCADQVRIAGKAEVDAIDLAPAHQGVAAETGIGAQQDRHARPAPADPADDLCNLLDRAGSCVDVGTGCGVE